MKRFTSFLLLWLALTSIAINGQVATGTIYGSVSDPSGSPVVGATVTLVHELTGATRTATTNEQGEVSIAFLSVGRYRLTISSQGFKEQTQAGIEVGAGQRLRLSNRLEVGDVSEKVTITSEAPLINAVNAEQQIAHSVQEVRELPLARRDWTNLLNVGAGMRVRESGGGTGVSMNGLPPGGLSLTVDGTQASSSSEETSLSQFGNFNLIKIVSLEAISEIKVSKGILSAEQANTLSGNIGLITKSGGNEFHGSLFENYLGGVLNARNQFLTTRPPEVFNQFGGSFGGPIIKNKLFIFGVYEGYRQRRFATLSGNVPTQELRAQAIAAVPAYKAFFDTLPLPNQPYTPGATVARYVGAGSNAANDDHLVFRGDYNINDLNRVTGRYTRGRPDSETPRVSAQNTRTFVGLDDVATASYFHTTASYSAETRFGFTRNNVERLDAMYGAGIANVNALGFDNGGETIQSRGKGYSIEQIVAINRGRHSLKVGGLFQRQNQTRFNVGVPNFAYGNNPADLLANDPTSATFSFGIDPYVINYWNNGYFIQDDFKIRPNLVLNLGLRYDYFSVPTEETGRLFNREEPFGLGALRSPDSIYNADRNNFAPRVGFAWTVDKSGKTVVRSGFGMYHTRAPLRNIVELVRNAIDEPFRTAFSRQEARALGIKYPLTNDDVLPLVRNPNAPWTGSTINPDFPTPYSMQWLLSVQRQLTNTISIDTAYVGTRGVHLVLNRVVNQVNRQTGLRPYAGFGEFRHFDTSDSTSYHAWQTSVQKRFSSDLLFNIHYTWSRSICYQLGDLSSLGLPQDFFNIRAERGPSAFDIPHRFAADFLYALPFNRWWSADSTGKRLLLNGWQIGGIYTAESGSPLDVAMPNALGGQRVDLTGAPVYLEENSSLFYLNRAAFATVPVIAASGASARPGTLGRNALRGLGFWNLDLSLSKSLQFTERIALQIRGDMFNAFNHTSFSGINTTITSGTFGQFTSTRGARVVQLNARLTF